jgi:hypothetical protein
MKDAKGHGSDPRGGGSTHQNGVKHVGVSDAVLNMIRSNPHGFSVTLDGKTPSGGYMVSLPGSSRIVRAADLAGENGRGIINDFAVRNAGALMQPGAHIGGWTDRHSGRTYLDVSQNIPGRFNAIQEGKKRNQIAIYDVRRGREIRTGGTGK